MPRQPQAMGSIQLYFERMLVPQSSLTHPLAMRSLTLLLVAVIAPLGCGRSDTATNSPQAAAARFGAKVPKREVVVMGTGQTSSTEIQLSAFNYDVKATNSLKSPLQAEVVFIKKVRRKEEAASRPWEEEKGYRYKLVYECVGNQWELKGLFGQATADPNYWWPTPRQLVCPPGHVEAITSIIPTSF